VIVGFGHFDLRIARTCGDLWQQGLASRILFTGGVGHLAGRFRHAGSGGLRH
jgi:hypothetical protein